MFGYITPLKPEMKVREFEIFKAYYCGVCTHIKNNFGNIPRFTLNYDLTFLSLILDSITDGELKIEKSRCIAHPFNKRIKIINNKALSYASIMNVSLVYYKLLDDANDDKSIKGIVGSKFLNLYMRKIDTNMSKINDIIEENLNKLSILEREKTFYSIDEIAHPFSEIVGNILKLYPEEVYNDSVETRELLYDLGYSLGKWIYIIDAVDDLKEDMKKEKFNPINILYNKENKNYEELIEAIKDKIEFTILSCGYRCTEAIENLDIKRNKEILENVIKLGMMDKYTKVINNCKEGKKENESI